MSRILAIDYGKRWVGIAISDELRIIANPLLEIDQKKEDILENMKDIFSKYKISSIIMGLPLTLSGKKTPLFEEIETFAEKIKEITSVEVIFWDERFTTKLTQKRGQKNSHKNAAAFLLQDYLDGIRMK